MTSDYEGRRHAHTKAVGTGGLRAKFQLSVPDA